MERNVPLRLTLNNTATYQTTKEVSRH